MGAHSFGPIATKLYDKYVIHGGNIGNYFWGSICQKLQKLGHFEILSTQDHMELKVFLLPQF